MFKPTVAGGLLLGAAVLLAACRGATPPPAPTPAAVQKPVDAPDAGPALATTEPALPPTPTPIPTPTPVLPTPAPVKETLPEPPSNTAQPDEMASAPEPAESLPGPTKAQQQLLDSLDVKGMPPELHNQVWLNSDPLKLAALRGKVVIVEFWTFG